MKKAINEFRRQLLYGITKHLKGSKKQFKEGEIDPSTIRKILVSRPNSRLGNLLMVTPLIQDIQRLLPQAEVDLFVRGGVGYPIFQNYTNVRQLIVLPSKPFKELGKYMKVWWNMRKNNYDLVLNVVPESSSGRLSVEFSNASLKDFGERIEALDARYPDYYHMAKIPVYNFRYLLEKSCGLVDEAPIPTLSFNLTPEEQKRGEEMYNSFVPDGRPTIYIYTFATGDKCYAKEWWHSCYAKLKENFSAYNIVEVLPKEKISQVDFLAPTYYSTDLHEMSAAISKGDLFITADCGVMHLASGSDIPVLALFNITSIDRYGPYNAGSKAVYCDQVTQEDIIRMAKEMLTKSDVA